MLLLNLLLLGLGGLLLVPVSVLFVECVMALLPLPAPKFAPQSASPDGSADACP
ncbi:hypothetical protein [Leptolyngbya sp. O-77]|uniref:hypothetical protein n=1 Tax=Leptolyngbya sp. O-77 TaxID=1080068 RepID=UPI00074D3336|nr:hypothetical protein [Leptolyngbya sp. O-77]BAU43377.1 hypothetical protein O77CONTIG1_03206 [Leptolyngbya sp. O-77]